MHATHLVNDAIVAAVARLRDEWQVAPMEGYWVVATPFRGPDLAPIELLIEPSDKAGQYFVSDGGYVADYFFMYGRALDEDEHLGERIADVAGSLGATVDEETLVMAASTGELADALARVCQAALSLPELWERPSERRHQPPFRARVGSQAARMSLPVEEELDVSGRVETHRFDLGNATNGRVVGIQTLSTTRRSRAHELRRMIAWDIADIRDAEVDLRTAVVVDDSSPRRRAAVPDDVVAPLRRMGGEVLYWTALEREDFQPLRLTVEGALLVAGGT